MTNSEKKATRYFVAVRPQSNERHSVHREGCPFMPDDNKRIFLGEFLSGEDALREGQKHFSSSNKCGFCSKDNCHEEREPVFSELETSFMPTENQLSLSGNGGLYYFLN